MLLQKKKNNKNKKKKKCELDKLVLTVNEYLPSYQLQVNRHLTVSLAPTPIAVQQIPSFQSRNK